jgi:type II secretory pathway component PulJ
VLHQLKNNKHIIIKLSDKNLGPVLDTASYVHQVLEEHLLSSDYRQLTKAEAQNSMDQLKSTLKVSINRTSLDPSDSQLTYFK